MNECRADHVGFLAQDVSRLMQRAFDRKLKFLGLSRFQLRLIVCLQRADRLSQTQLAKILDLGKSTLGVVMGGLEAEGWVELRPDLKDRRLKIVCLTPKANSIIKAIEFVGTQITVEIMKNLSEEEAEQIGDILTGVKLNLLDRKARLEDETQNSAKIIYLKK
jgi:DNA-binding MarR family transcriptional regulator